MVGGTDQNVTKRERILNTPRYKWLLLKTDEGELPLKRDIKMDESINLEFEVPENVKNEDCADHRLLPKECRESRCVCLGKLV